ncbi:MAG: hypothetical protein AAF991_13145 [Pseudomonadota bacterium]
MSPAEQGQSIDFSNYPLGSQLRILPNHACATAAQFREINVLENGMLTESWPRAGGW